MNGQSDKVYWHRYTDFYEQNVFSKEDFKNVLELGVLNGDSIRLLRERFPFSDIVGVDIIPEAIDWPKDKGIKYFRVDADDPQHLDSLYSQLNKRFDLIIDDASHRPDEQIRNLTSSLPYLISGGYYIIEDLDPSLLKQFQCIEHVQSSKITWSVFGPDKGSLLIGKLILETQKVYIYKRAVLPLNCYRCGKSDNFDYNLQSCGCGTDLMLDGDSISVILKKI